MKRYRIPTHLAVEPSLVRAELGPIPVDLTFRQAAALACAAGFAYWLWQGSGLPTGARHRPGVGGAGGAPCSPPSSPSAAARPTCGCATLLHYLARPRRLVWRADAGPRRPTSRRPPGPRRRSRSPGVGPPRPAEAAD